MTPNKVYDNGPSVLATAPPTAQDQISVGPVSLGFVKSQQQETCQNRGLEWISPWIIEPNPKQNLVITSLLKTDPEYHKIEKKFKESMKGSIIDIKKITNHKLRVLFESELKEVKKVNNNADIDYVKLLFHGTSKLDPSLVYNGDKCFMTQYAIDGFLGRGTYFSEKPSYAANSAFHGPKSQKSVFLAEVIVGDSCSIEQDKNLKIPPEKNSSGVRYDSVNGKQSGSKVYVVYDHNKAYPTYLIIY
uniref:Poly [ADP-ribose] polymerase n=1 Tax=Arcella intermedia TaxID=1963864 RepID=A0A6B2LDE1_9EUKA